LTEDIVKQAVVRDKQSTNSHLEPQFSMLKSLDMMGSKNWGALYLQM